MSASRYIIVHENGRFFTGRLSRAMWHREYPEALFLTHAAAKKLLRELTTLPDPVLCKMISVEEYEQS